MLAALTFCQGPADRAGYDTLRRDPGKPRRPV